MKEEKLFNFLECACIFFSILFKYLLNLGISKTILYGYLGILLIITLMNLFYKKLKKRELLICIVLASISVFYIIFYQDVNFLISFMLAMLSIRKDETNFIKNFFIFSLILYVLTIFSHICGFIPERNIHRIDVNGISKIRYSLGFTHPNEVFLYFIPIALSGYYLYSDKKIFYIIIFITSSILYYFSDCRTGFATILLLIFLGMFSKKIKKMKIEKIVPYLFLIFTIISIILAIVYGKSSNNYVSRTLSGRPYYWNYYINNNKLISIWGNNKVEGFFLDNFYIYILVQLGMLGYIIYSYIYYYSLKKMNNNFEYMIIALVFLVYGIFEANVIIGSIQFLFTIQIKNLIVKENKKEE